MTSQELNKIAQLNTITEILKDKEPRKALEYSIKGERLYNLSKLHQTFKGHDLPKDYLKAEKEYNDAKAMK